MNSQANNPPVGVAYRGQPVAWYLLVWTLLVQPAATNAVWAEPPVTSLACAPDARQIVAGSQAGVQVLALPALDIRDRFIPKFANVHALAFSPDQTRLAVAGGEPADSGVVEILSWPQLESLQLLSGHVDSVMAVQWLSDREIASASLDQRVIVWNVASGQPIRVLQGHSRGLTSLAHVREQGILVSGGIDQSLRVWRIETGELLHSLTMHTQSVNALATRPLDEGLPMVASCSDDRSVRFWQPTIGRMVRFARLPARPLCLRWLSAGTRIAAGCDNGQIYWIDPESTEVVAQHRCKDSDWIYALSSTLDDKLIFGDNLGRVGWLGP